MKRKTGISVMDNLGIRREVNMEVGPSIGYNSGDILDANAVLKLIQEKIAEVVGGASSSSDTLKEIETTLGNKQNKLVSGSNIKTIDGTAIIGSGDLKEVIEGIVAEYIASQNEQTEPTEEEPPL